MNIWVYDLEVLPNLFTATFRAVEEDSEERKQFVIHSTRDEREVQYDERQSLMAFLLSPDLKLIGYNVMHYDYQILHRLIELRNRFPFTDGSSKQLSEWIYSISQDIINGELNTVPEWKYYIPQRDLFKIHHFDNKARRTSLKHLEVAMNARNVMDMPIAHDDWIEKHQIEEVLFYNDNDVINTKAFYWKSQKEISMRREVGKAFGIYIMNDNDPRIGQEIILKEIAKDKGVDVRTLRDLRTHRNTIKGKDVILDIVDFKLPTFQKVLEEFKNAYIDAENMKDAFSTSVLFDGMVYEFGVGGLHACRESQIWKPDEHNQLCSADVTSYYPNLAVQHGFYPEHLGESFTKVYRKLFYERKKYPKGTPENYGLKIALNGVFGKSNDKYSPLYDPKVTMQITINGQLLLAMLCEELTFAGCKVVMANTDGIEVMVPVHLLETYQRICSDWEELTELELEHVNYKKLCIRDVNNYIGQFEDGNVYLKGTYEIDKAWHKNHSMKVVALAVHDFFIKGTPVMRTLREHHNLYDFMLSVRMRKDCDFIYREVVDQQGIQDTILPRTNRYLIVHNGIGGYLLKRFSDGRETRINSGWKVLLCNDMHQIEQKYMDEDILKHIDYRFYYEEAMKLISPIITQQTKLFE